MMDFGMPGRWGRVQLAERPLKQDDEWFHTPHTEGYYLGLQGRLPFRSTGFARIWWGGLPLTEADVDLRNRSEKFTCALWRWCALVINNPCGTRSRVIRSTCYRLAAINGKLSA